LPKKRPAPSLVKASAPCRLDCGGTLDLAPLALGLEPLQPATFNIALDLPTEVEVRPNPGGGVRVESSGFEPQTADQEADYSGPLGFFFLAAHALDLKDVSLTIRSASPPRSALGGSSAAILAAVAALARLAGRRMSRFEAVRLAHELEQALFMMPCGRQDHLAAAYGGVHLWTWSSRPPRGYKARKLLKGVSLGRLEDRLLVAYPGQIHASADINGRWLKGFVAGESRRIWREIVRETHGLAEAVARGDWTEAARRLEAECRLRLELTPEVLTEAGRRLFEAASALGVGARFSGAGGGGCLWALGPKSKIDRLRPVWLEILGRVEGARMLPSRIDRRGLTVAIVKVGAKKT